MSAWITAGITFLVGAAGGFVGSTAGGSGLVVLPMLMFLGMSGKEAVAAFEVAALGMMLSSGFRLRSLLDKQVGPTVTISTVSAVGALCGVLLLVSLPNEAVPRIIGACILVLCLVMIFWPQQGLERRPRSATIQGIGLLLFFFSGFWSGLISAGAHTLCTWILVVFFGRTFLESAAILKIQGLVTGVVSVVVLGSYGFIPWVDTTMLLIGMTIGGYYGADAGMRMGESWVRGIYIALATAAALKLILD